MIMKTLIGQILMLLIMSFTSSSKANENLECYSDYIDIITCIWNTSSVEDRFHITPTTNCSLQSQYDKSDTIKTVQSNLEPLGSSHPKLLKGTLQFVKESLSLDITDVPLYVWCENKAEPLETIDEFEPIYNVKLYPPGKPLVDGANVTWQHGFPHVYLIKKVKYEVEWSLLEDNWQNSRVSNTEEERCEIPEDMLTKGRQYVVRVRSTPRDTPRFWSEWSPVTQWTATVGSQPRHETDNDRILSLLTNLTSISAFVAVVVLLLLICILRCVRIMKCPYIPTPGKYFGNLFSDHGGDFKSWLGPIVNPEMYIKVDLECISPVTIQKPKRDANIRDCNSNFSNSTYFLSQSSKCVLGELERCSSDCPYGPAAGGSMQEKNLPATHDDGNDSELSEVSMSTPLETSSSYKQLQKLRLDIQSPDSGFAGSSEEQESQEESGSEGLPSPPVVDDTLPISCILPCPVPHQIGFPHLGMPPGQAWNQWNSQTFTILPPGIPRNVLLEDSGIITCSGILEPSSDDYMPG